MKNAQYCIRQNFDGMKPHEKGFLVSIFETYEEANLECNKLHESGKEGIYVCQYDENERNIQPFEV